MGQKNNATKPPIAEMDKSNPKYDDFVVEPSSSLFIKEYILTIITKQRMMIPNVIIELIISYYSLSSTYKIYQPVKIHFEYDNSFIWACRLKKVSSLCTTHPSHIWYSLKSKKHFFQTHENELYEIVHLSNHNKYQHVTKLTKASGKNFKISIVSNGIYAGHTFIVEKDGTIYGFGKNDKYKLGNDSDKNALVYKLPTLRSSLTSFFAKKTIVKIECGSSWSLFLCANGRIYSFGYNVHGECGVKGKFPCIPTPRLIASLKNITDICCGSTFSFCLDKNHKVWCFGDNSAGYLSLGHNEKINEPLLHPFFKNMDIEYIRCGSRHAMIISFDGNCYLCKKDSKNPNLYQKKVKNGWCGSDHSVVYTVENELIAFGATKFEWNRTDHGIDGLKSNQYIVRVMPGHNETFLIVHNNNEDVS